MLAVFVSFKSAFLTSTKLLSLCYFSDCIITQKLRPIFLKSLMSRFPDKYFVKKNVKNPFFSQIISPFTVITLLVLKCQNKFPKKIALANFDTTLTKTTSKCTKMKKGIYLIMNRCLDMMNSVCFDEEILGFELSWILNLEIRNRGLECKNASKTKSHFFLKRTASTMPFLRRKNLPTILLSWDCINHDNVKQFWV